MPARPRASQLLSLGLFYLCPSWLEDGDHQHVARVARSPGTGRAALCKKSLWVGKLLSWLETMVRGCCCKHKGNPRKESTGGWEGALPARSWLGLLGLGQIWGCGGSPPLLGWGFGRAPGRCFLTTQYQSWFPHPPLPGQSFSERHGPLEMHRVLQEPFSLHRIAWMLFW